MTPTTLYGLTAAAIFALAFYGLITARHLLRKLVALNVMGSGVFLLFVAMARRGGGDPDPVPHAMVLTGIVVTAGATGLAVALIRRSFADRHEDSLPEDQRAAD